MRKVSQKSLRAAIGMVPQELSLGFGGRGDELPAHGNVVSLAT